METAAAIREESRAALDDVDPSPLRRTAFDAIDDSWGAPAEFVLRAARRAGAGPGEDRVESRAVGVQLVYAGLALTRRLVADVPWEDGDAGDADVEVLVADVLVARGTHLLADTEAAERCVDVIRRFGRRETDGGPVERSLEADALELAAVAGSTVEGVAPDATVLEWAAALASAYEAGERPDVDAVLPAVDGTPSGQPAVANEGRQSGTDP